ncbi:hypothetical protein AGOR_G00126170 [Albula goreensis]|uniref:SH3 domain-containing protein n=1 Tax=Albula goreensis TaxID=1534307 RepID=A0A8T3DFC4_9TELE|nr:hypothetical protein AGOR_G00126170 [Albula goreensis]
MNPQASYNSSMLFHTIDQDLTASLAMADELSREFNSLLQESSSSQTVPTAELEPAPSEARLQKGPDVRLPVSSDTRGDRNVSIEFSQSQPYSHTAQNPELSHRPLDPVASSYNFSPSSPGYSPLQFTPPMGRRERTSSNRSGSDSSFTHGQLTPPNQSPRTQRRRSPSRLYSYDSTKGAGRRSPSPSLMSRGFKQSHHVSSPTVTLQYDCGHMGQQPNRRDQSPSPRPFRPSASSTLPRNFTPLRPADETVQKQKTPAKWNETDLDMAYERKPHHTYDKSEWLRPSVPNSNWRESNLDAPPPASRKDSQTFPVQSASLPRKVRLMGSTDQPSSPRRGSTPYSPQPIISRISIPPTTPQARQHRPIPLSVIMRLQNPQYFSGSTHNPRGGGRDDSNTGTLYRQLTPLHQEYLPQPAPAELRQPGVYGEVLNPEDVEAELERQDPVRGQLVPESGSKGLQSQDPAPVPRPLSPTRLQPMVAPEIEEVHDRQELLRLRAEIPRALKRRGSVEQSQPYAKVQYKQIINKLFRRTAIRHRGEQGSESSSSSEGEDGPMTHPSASLPSTVVTPEQKGLSSILRKSSRDRKGSGRRATLSPLVLLLDGALVGELETVQRAVQEMNDPSQPNDEGITALHNAICGGHYAVVDFLVRIGANVSAPDSHGWTPLHCAASCNDQVLCEYLVRNGAAVMAVTESDGATAAQKCDPFAPGFEDCESFMRGVEDAMGVENSGVLYALWGYPAQAPDELSFKEGDMVTILEKPEGVDWWWASLCGREGFVPNNYFGLFPKVRPKSLC